MTQTIKEVKVRGYNKTHTFNITKTTMAGVTFYQFNKNGNKVLNCTPQEFEKFLLLFSH